MKYYIYKVTNKVNQKVYVGKSKDPSKRLRGHWISRFDGSHFHNALIKYGLKNFELSELEEHDTEELANEAEKRLIAENKSQDVAFGYNMTAGGDGVCNPCEEIRRRMRDAHLGKKMSQITLQRMSAAQKGRVMSEEHRKNLSKARKASAERKGFTPMSDAAKEKLSALNTGSKNKAAKLNEDNVKEIKKLIVEGVLTLHVIGLKFGVSRHTIGAIKSGRLWASVKQDDAMLL